MEDCKAMATTMSTTTAFDADEEGEHVDQKEYRSMIRSLLYLMVTRPRTCSSRYVCVLVLSISKDFASASSQAHIQILASHSQLRPLVLRVFFFTSSWFFRRGFCRVSVG
jgi:hypothetical protein